MNDKGDEHDYVFNVVMLGDIAVGKTTFLARFAQDQFIDTSATICLDVQTKIIELGGKRINCCVWDTAGQEMFGAVTNSFFRRADGVFLMYDISRYKSFGNLNKWLNDVNTFADEDVVKILVGNKSDLEPSVYTYEAHEYANKNGMSFIETSAKDSTNVTVAFQIMVAEIYRKKLLDGFKEFSKTIVLLEKETDKK